MITVVFDTNILASGFMRKRGAPARLVTLWTEEAFELVVSDHILDELARTFQKPYFLKRLTTNEINQSLQLIDEAATHTQITVDVHDVATHAEDDLVLATALSGNAEYLVTGDKGLLAVGSYAGITVLPPRAFLERLEAEAE